MNPSIVPAIATSICMLSLAQTVESAVIINAVESGGDVIFSSNGGTLHLGGLTFDEENDYSPTVKSASLAFLWLGAPGADIPVDNYATVSGPTSFGSGGAAFPDFGSGGLYGIDMTSSSPLLSVPRGYVSGQTLDPASMTFESSTFSALGISEGLFVWSWGDGDGVNGDTMTLNVVPEPSSTLLVGLSLTSFAFLRKRRKN